MLFKIIMLSTILITFIIIYFSLNMNNKPQKNMYLGVTLPKEALESEIVKNIQIEYKSCCKRFYLIMLITALPLIFDFWIFKNITFYSFYSIIWIVGFCYAMRIPFVVMHRKLKAQKIKNKWFIGETKVVYCDTKTTMLKNTMPISDKYFLIPILIGIVPIIMCLKYPKQSDLLSLSMAILNFVMVLMMFFITKNINNKALKTYTTNSEVNFVLNKAERRMLSIYFFVNILFESIMFLLMYLMLFEFISLKLSTIIITAVIILSLLLSLGYVYIKYKMNILEEELLSTNDGQEVIVDDDDYWIDGIYYCNPNDKRKMVSSRFGYGTTYNIANKFGYFMTKQMDKIVLAICAVVLGVVMIPQEILPTKIEIAPSSSIIAISSFPYSYEFDLKNVESIELSNEPISFKLRKNGIATDTKLIGNFTHSEYGLCRIYLFPKDCSSYILMKINNSKFDYIIYSEKDDAKNKEVFDKLIDKYNSLTEHKIYISMSQQTAGK